MTQNWSRLRKAEAQVATGHVGEESRRQIEQVLADLAMLAALEEIRLRQADVKHENLDIAGAGPAYVKAFQSYGIDVQTLPVQEAAARIRQRTIAIHLAAALDNWAMALPIKENQRRQQLFQVAQESDPDPWRCSLRQVLASEKGANASLIKLVPSAPIEKLPLATLHLFARALRVSRAAPLAVDVLRKAQRHYPADFWINHELGVLLDRVIKPPQVDEAIGFYRAALALRSASPVVHLNLGNAFHHKDLHDDAIACYRQAIRLKSDFAAAHFNLGNVLNAKGQLDDAVASYQQAIRVKEDFALAYFNLGVTLMHKSARRRRRLFSGGHKLEEGLAGGPQLPR